MNEVKQIHAFSLRNGLNYTQILITKLLKIPNISYAHQLFDQMPQPTSTLYNKLIQAYSHHGPQHKCFSLYTQMYTHKCYPNPLTFTFLFAACTSLSSLHIGKIVHAHLVLSGFKHDVFVLTALIDMYAKMGFVNLGRKQFDHMVVKDTPTWNAMISGYTKVGEMEKAEGLFEMVAMKNVVTWTSMVSGYSQNGMYVKALECFLLMKAKGVEPNEVSVVSVLSACANLGALEVGESVEEYARRKGYMENLFVCNGLLEMYAKCGKLDKAMEMFNEIREWKNLCSWNCMMMGFAIHGRHGEALHLFEVLMREGMVPDAITFVAALMACTHGGKIVKGRQIFELMKDKFGITPRLEHYGCMVDLLGRKGKLNEAYNCIQTMPMKPDSVIWGTLLGACSFHGNIEVAEKAAEALFELEPWNSGNYVILCNIYASKGRWDGVAKLRKMMKGSKLTKTAGYSCIEEADKIHMFIVEDKSHPRSNEIYKMLEDVYCMIMKNYNGDENVLITQIDIDNFS